MKEIKTLLEEALQQEGFFDRMKAKASGAVGGNVAKSRLKGLRKKSSELLDYLLDTEQLFSPDDSAWKDLKNVEKTTQDLIAYIDDFIGAASKNVKAKPELDKPGTDSSEISQDREPKPRSGNRNTNKTTPDANTKIGRPKPRSGNRIGFDKTVPTPGRKPKRKMPKTHKLPDDFKPGDPSQGVDLSKKRDRSGNRLPKRKNVYSPGDEIEFQDRSRPRRIQREKVEKIVSEILKRISN